MSKATQGARKAAGLLSVSSLGTLSPTLLMGTPQQIHMIAISGVGMAALAGLLKQAGHHVRGSDAGVFPPMSSLLTNAGIPYKNGFNKDHIDPSTDLVIIGNAVSKENPEAIEALARGIRYLSLPQAISEFFLKERVPLVVTGTHGKTTTTSLLSWVLTSAGLDPSVMVGGLIKNFNTNHRLGKGNYFVIEGDEYNSAFFDPDPKFLHYRPHHAIITSIEVDHTDIYPDLEAMKNAFKRFVRLIPKKGRLIAGYEPTVLEVAAEAACPVITYGFSPEADWQAMDIAHTEGLTVFDLYHYGDKVGTVHSPLIGRHNIKNSLAVIALADHIGVPHDAIFNGIRLFEGVSRRQEVVAEVGGILIIDDFAHHPTAIAETLSALRLRYPTRRLWAIFEPRSASSRRNVFQKEFVTALCKADCIVLADLFAPEKVPANQRLDPQQVILDLHGQGKKESFFIPTTDAIISFLAGEEGKGGGGLQPGDLVCIMSSGGFGGIYTTLPKRLKARAPHV